MIACSRAKLKFGSRRLRGAKVWGGESAYAPAGKSAILSMSFGDPAVLSSCSQSVIACALSQMSSPSPTAVPDEDLAMAVPSDRDVTRTGAHFGSTAARIGAV